MRQRCSASTGRKAAYRHPAPLLQQKRRELPRAAPEAFGRFGSDGRWYSARRHNRGQPQQRQKIRRRTGQTPAALPRRWRQNVFFRIRRYFSHWHCTRSVSSLISQKPGNGHSCRNVQQNLLHGWIAAFVSGSTLFLHILSLSALFPQFFLSRPFSKAIQLTSLICRNERFPRICRFHTATCTVPKQLWRP